jgi:hypothetical protein
MELNECEGAVNQGQNEGCHPEMSPVVEQGKEPAVNPDQRTDREDSMQQNQRRNRSEANDERLDGSRGVEEKDSRGVASQAENQQGSNGNVINPLLAIPADGAVRKGHRAISS